MLREDFFEILNFTKRKGIGIKIISNGTLINESNIRRLKEIAPLNIQISLYGATARIHDFTTRLKGSFEKTMHAIELLKANKLSFAITTMVLNHNFNELSLMKDMAKKRKWEILFDFIIRPMDSGSKKPLKHRVTDNQIKNAYNLNLLPFVNKNRKLKHYNKRDICVGNIGRTHIFISSEGGVFPDITLRTKIGDLRKNSIYDIWYNSKKLNWLRNLNLSDFECSKCKYLLNCSWITGLALAEHHDLFKRPKEYCRFIKYIVS